MNPAQIVLIVVIVALAIVFIALGVQVFLILREVKKTVVKTNMVLDDTELITKSVATPLSNLSTLASGVKAGAFLASLLKRHKKKED